MNQVKFMAIYYHYRKEIDVALMTKGLISFIQVHQNQSNLGSQYDQSCNFFSAA